MIRLEGSGSDCTMGAGFREDSVYSTYTPTDPLQKANWLPAPNGPIYTVLRMYWPKESVLNGSWEPPGIQAVK
jgi:hypothetical protein